LKRTVTFALWPSSRKRRTCFSLKSKSCFSVLGPIFTSFTWIVVCFLRASLSRRACVYLYLPKSMIRQTGGWASGATSTRSSSRGDLAREVGDDAVECNGAEVLARPVAQADRAAGALALADDEHVGDLVHLSLADPVAELLVAVVELGAEPGPAQALPHRPRV